MRGTRITRRTLLQALAGSTLAGMHIRARAAAPRIAIAGAGIIGAQLAWRLAQRGADVTLIERAAPAVVATAASFAWINATWDKQPREYFRLNSLGIAAWHQLQHELRGALPLAWGGSIEWYADEASATKPRAGIRRHQGWGYPMHAIDVATLRRLEPKLEPGAVALAAWAANEGHVDPVLATQLLVEQAKRAGARVLHPVEVRGLVERKGRLRAVSTSAGEVEAEVLVIACGTDTPVLARMAGFDVPLKDSPGVLVHTRPLPPLIERVVLAPVAHLKQKPDGRVVIGADFEGSARADASLDAARRVLARASSVLPALAGEEPDFVTMGFRPLPRDDFPVIGFAPGRRDVYVAVMHSGITLSPAVANLAAMELLDGVATEPLAPYRPERFAS